MTEKPTESTYVVELAKAISKVGEELGFDAESFKRTGAGYPDVVLKYQDRVVAVIEVKQPNVLLNDPELERQALRYAEWYRREKGVEFYGVHNMKYIALYRYREKAAKDRKTLLDYVPKPEDANWVPAVDFPFPIIPWATSIDDYKAITTNKQARENLGRFLLALKELLDGKTLDPSKEVIGALRSFIEDAAVQGKSQLKEEYERSTEVRDLVERWIGERGLETPRNVGELMKYLELLLKEQAYTFSVKLLFYLVLQSIDADMAGKLRESVRVLENATDPEFFKRTSEELFKYAIERTQDFEEVFGANIVDRLPVMPASLRSYQDIVRYLSQVKWSNVGIDVIGRIFEGLIHEERRHLLGQHYTAEKIVDLILEGVFRRNNNKLGSLLDPACGSGTFLVRALLRWRIMRPEETMKLRAHELLEGCDIDKLAAMLAKVNLHIQSLGYIKEQVKTTGRWFSPRIYHADFFKLSPKTDYSYVVTNPPYTRQEEMALAYFARDYKALLKKVVEDIDDWDDRASIYAYFLVRGGKLLKEGGRLGYIVENSWLNAEYGGPLKRWLFSNFRVEYVIESLVERWFEDASVITNIVIAERGIPDENAVTRFAYLKKPLSEIVGGVPPASDVVAMLNYYGRIRRAYDEMDGCSPTGKPYEICEGEQMKVVAVRKGLVEKIESKLGRLGVLRAPETYLNSVLDYIDGRDDRFKLLGEVIEIRRGLTTNANELFYLPSKWWEFLRDTESYLELRPASGKDKTLRISKKYLRRLVRLDHLTGQPYEVSQLPVLKREDYVLWVEDADAVEDPGTRAYIEWARQLVTNTYRSSGGRKFSTIFKKIGSRNAFKLPSTSGGTFLLRNAIYESLSIWLNRAGDVEVDERLYVGYVKEGYRSIEAEVLFAILNSVITYVGIELLGRANLGEGALDIKTIDYEKVVVPDPQKFREYLDRGGLLRQFLADAKRMLKLKPANIAAEVNSPERRVVEEYIFKFLGLKSSDIDTINRSLIELVRFRTERAKRPATTNKTPQ